LDGAGARLEDVVKTTVDVASDDQTDLLAAWEVVSRHFCDHDAPSTLVGVAVLGYREQLVEVEAIACAPLSLHEVERPRGQGDSAFPGRLSPGRSSAAAGCSGVQSLRARQCG
jgi:hypothetical protein